MTPQSRGPRRDRSAPGRNGHGSRRDPELAARRDRLSEIVTTVVAPAGYDLEELTVARVGRRELVRVVVDSDQGVSLEAVADLSRGISHALDEAESTGGDFFAQEYQLEVSSPGVDRPLTEPRHWRRNVGRLVSVPIAGRAVVGRVTAAGDTAVDLDVGGTTHTVSYGELGAGRVQIEFSRLEQVSDDDLEDISDEEGEDET